MRVRRIDGERVAYREITVIEIKEVLRLWLQGKMGLRPIAEAVGVDRKTVRRYIEAAQAAGLVRDGGEGQLTDELIGAGDRGGPSGTAGGARRGVGGVPGRARADQGVARAGSEADRRSRTCSAVVAWWCRTGRCTVTPLSELGFGGRGTTVPVVDGEPGHELQVDFGRLGMMFDPDTGRRRALWALIFTAHLSRHTFVWCTWTPDPRGRDRRM